MKLSTLNERINNTVARIEKKTATMHKKVAAVEKAENQLVKLGFCRNDSAFDVRDNFKAWEIACRRDNAEEDIERLAGEIEEAKKALANYEAQKRGEMEREEIIAKEIPASMRMMQNELVNAWDASDKLRREYVRNEYAELGYKGFFQKHTRADYDFKDITNDQIHDSNVEAAKTLVLDMYNRVKEITGNVTNWDGIRAEVGTWGCPVLNGTVIGDRGRCTVESILAGGYNIQKLHVRVLVKEF